MVAHIQPGEGLTPNSRPSVVFFCASDTHKSCTVRLLMRRVLSTLRFFLLLLIVPITALAGAGSVKMMASEVKEKEGEWLVKVRIDLPKAPGMAHVPMRFTFAKTVVYERAVLVEGKPPVLNKVQLSTSPKQIVSMDVDFADMRGKIHNATVFEFALKRASGFFEAGEYQLQVNGPDGDIGGGQKLILLGDNPTVYRGEMSFAQKKPDAGAEEAGAKPAETPPPAAVPTEVEPVGTGSALVPKDAYDRTKDEEIKERPKGCGCRVASRDRGPYALLLGAVGAFLLSRRRARS